MSSQAHFSNMTVSQLLAALASPDPTPGGGTASAVVGAMGTSLLVMVTGLAKSKSNTDDEKAALAAARATVTPITGTLTQLADADTEAFNAVMAAYRLPKGSDDEKAARTQAIQQALRGATEVPLATLRACAQAVDAGRAVASHGNRSAASDVGVAFGLLKAAADGAAANVRINLDSIKDETYRAATAAELSRLSDQVATQCAEAIRALAD